MLTRMSSRPNVSTACCDECAGAVPRRDVVVVRDGGAAGGGDLVDDRSRRPPPSRSRSLTTTSRAFGGEQPRVAASDAATRAGDDRDLAVEHSHPRRVSPDAASGSTAVDRAVAGRATISPGIDEARVAGAQRRPVRLDRPCASTGTIAASDGSRRRCAATISASAMRQRLSPARRRACAPRRDRRRRQGRSAPVSGAGAGAGAGAVGRRPVPGARTNGSSMRRVRLSSARRCRRGADGVSTIERDATRRRPTARAPAVARAGRCARRPGRRGQCRAAAHTSSPSDVPGHERDGDDAGGGDGQGITVMQEIAAGDRRGIGGEDDDRRMCQTAA